MKRLMIAMMVLACTDAHECVELGSRQCKSAACRDALSGAKEAVSSKGIQVCELPGDDFGLM